MAGGVKKKNKGRNYGHLKGVETVKKIVKDINKAKNPSNNISMYFHLKIGKDHEKRLIFS